MFRVIFLCFCAVIKARFKAVRGRLKGVRKKPCSSITLTDIARAFSELHFSPSFGRGVFLRFVFKPASSRVHMAWSLFKTTCSANSFSVHQVSAFAKTAIDRSDAQFIFAASPISCDTHCFLFTLNFDTINVCFNMWNPFFYLWRIFSLVSFLNDMPCYRASASLNLARQS